MPRPWLVLIHFVLLNAAKFVLVEDVVNQVADKVDKVALSNLKSHQKLAICYTIVFFELQYCRPTSAAKRRDKPKINYRNQKSENEAVTFPLVPVLLFSHEHIASLVYQNILLSHTRILFL